MLKIRISAGGKKEFFCPQCGVDDSYFLNTPAFCHKCNLVFAFDVETLQNNEEARVKYYAYYRICS